MLEKKSFAFLSKAAITLIFLSLKKKYWNKQKTTTTTATISPSQFRDVIFHIIDTEHFLNNVEFTIHLSFDFSGDGKLSYSEFIDLMKDRVQRGFQVR